MVAALAVGGLVGVPALSASGSTGTAPTVHVGPDQTVNLKDTAFLPGKVSDDGLPDPSWLEFRWTKISGPGGVVFGRTDEAHTTARFEQAGTYVLQLAASDGSGSGADQVTINVRNDPGTTIHVPADHPTIQQALDAAPTNALVLVSPGTYRESLYVPRSLTLASTHYTTGDESVIETTIISNPDAESETVVVGSGAGPDTRISGFTVRDGKDGIKIRGAGVVEHNLLTNLATDAVDLPRDKTGLVMNNVMEHNGDDAVDVNESSPVIVNNIMRNNAGDGVEIRVTNMVAPIDEVIIRDNVIVDNTQDGIQIIDDDAIAASPAESATLFRIDRNIIANNLQAGLGLMDNGKTSEDYRGASLVERITVTNNTFVGNNHGITGGDNLVAVNNVFAGHSAYALKNVDATSQTAYNQFHANGATYVASNLDPQTSFTGDPKLDASYAPRSDSPVIDAGTASFRLSSGETAVTVEGFRGTAPDIGAIESGATRTNQAPSAHAGADLVVTLPDTGSLDGSVTDDGLPSGSLTARWSKVSGPGTVTFAAATQARTTAAFSDAGTYVLALTADDGALTDTDTVTVVVDPDPSSGGGDDDGGSGGDDGAPTPEPTDPGTDGPIAGPPDMVTAVAARPGNASVTVTWTAPRDNGSRITKYTVTSSPGGHTASVGGEATQVTVTGLVNGTGYTFTVVATNAVGSSVPSLSTKRVVPATRPNRVRRPKVRVVGKRAIVMWRAPANGGAPIKRYRVLNGRGKMVVVPGTARRVVFRKLPPARYAFRVVAVNRVGRSVRSLPRVVRISRIG